MNRAARLERLVAYRRREVDAAAIELEQARRRTRDAEAAIETALDALRGAREAPPSRATAGDLGEHDAWVRALVARRARAMASHEAARRAEDRARERVVGARVELKKMETVRDALLAAEDASEARAAQRAIDERVAAKRGDA